MKYFCIPALVSLTIAFAVLVGKDAIVLYGTVAGFFFTLVTLAGALACVKAHRDLECQAKEDTRVTGRQAVIAGLGAGVILLGYILLAMTVLGNAREFGKSAVSAANLRCLGAALREWVEGQGDYPQSAERIVAADIATWDQFRAFGDLTAPSEVPEVGYSSYVYQPGAGGWLPEAKIVLAYEREAWTPLALRVFPRYGRYVLFGDGRVTLLDDEAFNMARQWDVQKRAELNWPPPANE